MPLNRNVDHVSVLVHSSPEKMPLALDVHEEFIQMPDVSRPSLPTPEPSCELRPELPAPPPDGLVGDRDSSLRQESLDVSEAQSESIMEPDSVTDDLGRESVSVVTTTTGFHRPSL
jgi:hypothetical protein